MATLQVIVTFLALEHAIRTVAKSDSDEVLLLPWVDIAVRQHAVVTVTDTVEALDAL